MIIEERNKKIEFLYSQGLLIKEIASILNIKYGTVGYWLSVKNIFKKYPRKNSGRFSTTRQYSNRHKFTPETGRKAAIKLYKMVRSGKIKSNVSKKTGCINPGWFKIKSHHWNWKGGRTKLRNKIRDLSEMVEWRKNVFIRDKYTCQKCRKKSTSLQAHHIISFAFLIKNFLNKYKQFNVLRDKDILLQLAITYKPFWDINNGQTLCEKCHKHCFRIKHSI